MTTFKTILDRTYLTLMTDYQLDNLKRMNEEVFYQFLSGFLINSISMFNGCLNSLSYHEEEVVINDTTQKEYVFDEELTDKEIYILCLGIALGWYEKHLDDVTQYEMHMSTKEFKKYSESQNISKRQDRLIMMEEKFSNEIQNYLLGDENILSMLGGV